MDFRILGPLEVSQGDPIRLGGPRQRALLTLLLLRANENVSRDWLIDELWEERPPRSGATALHNHVARLRRTLGHDRVLTRPDGYTLRLEPGELDLERFETLVAGAAGLPLRERAEHLREALALWHGAPLGGQSLGGFAAAEAARLEELRVGVLEDLIDAELELGRHAELVSELTALVAAHPLSERLRGQLILALYRCGRQAEALDVYRETRRLLDEELGLEPSPALKQLERAILRHDPELAPAKPASPPQAGSLRNRRPAYAAAAAVLLAAAGGSSGWLLTRDGGSEPTAVPPAPASSSILVDGTEQASTEDVAAPLQKPAARPRRRTTTQQAVTTTPAARPKPKVRVRQTTPAVTVPVVTTTTAPPPAATTTQKRQPEPKPKPFTISDDFSLPTIDSLVWYTVGKENGAVFAQRDGRLEITIVPEAEPDAQWNQVGGHYGTHCRFTGDFDARVDFELLSWPPAAGVYAGINAYFADAAVVRQSSAQWGDQYGAWVVPTAGGFALPDVKGRFRMKRVDGVITNYFWLAGRWRKLVSGVSRRTAVIGLQVQANGDEFSREEVRVAYDNFSVTATEADCPAWADPRDS
jgi:DNA-binding SARP family transcriptional activator